MQFVFVTDIKQVLDAALVPGPKILQTKDEEDHHTKLKRRKGEKAAAKAQV
jgi:hypothetical protein